MGIGRLYITETHDASISDITRPIIISLIVIVSGLVLAKGKPRPRSIVGYSLVVVILILLIIISLIFVTCAKPPIVGMNS